MTHTRTSAVAALAGIALVLSGCGTENAGDSPDSGSGTTPDSQKPSIAASSDTPSDTLGTEILNQRLDVPPAEYPLPDVPTQVEVASVAELGEAFAVVPGIDEIVASLEGTTLDSGERLFAYTVNACTTEDVALELRGTEVPMVVSGTSTLRCAPPTTLVVWVVGDEIPADATPAQAIQK